MPISDNSNYSLLKPLFAKRVFVFIFISMLLSTAIIVFPQPAYAGLFSGVWKFFVGGADASVETSTASVSMPLLGSQSKLSQIGGIGGPDESVSPLSITGDSAIVALRNPAGTIPSPLQDQIFIYTVVYGDTPSMIAERFGITLNTLLWANDIRNQNLIKIGDDLIILPVTGIQYEVKKGDTLDSIARRFKSDVADIMGFNGLVVGEPLLAGETLIIPDGEFASQSPTQKTPAVSRFANLPEQPGYYARPIIGGRKSQGIHGFNGVDLANYCGAPVLVSAQGTVIVARSSGWNGGYGKYVVITHPNGTQTLYAHLDTVFVSVGQPLARSSQIGTVGRTGNSTGCHVHFEIRGAKNPF